jgi:diguanylate cyclase (GGDEF)-like protein
LPQLRNPLALRLIPLVLALACGLLTLSLAAAIATRHWLVLPKLRELEARSDHKDLRRVLLAIDGKKLQLVTLAYKNAVWDGMYDFIAKPNAYFFDSSFPLDTLLNFKIDIVALFDEKNRILEQRIVDDKQSTFIDAPLPLLDLSPHLIDLRKVQPHAPIFDSGFIKAANGPLMFAVAGVMRSDAGSNARGNLLFATYFDNELLTEIEENAQVHLAFAPVAPAETNAPIIAVSDVYRGDNNQLSWLLRDNNGLPVLKLILTLPQRSYDVDLWALPLAVSFVTNLIGATIMLILFQRALILPMLGIGNYLRRVRESGDYTQRLDSKLRTELGELSRDIDALVQHVHVQQQQLQAQTTEMQALSFQDGLTGLANRRRFDQALTDNWAHAQRGHAPLALIMLDVDYFKNYNDHYGHQQGDEALKQLAAIIRHVVVRQSDVAARYGGEEFAILLPETAERSAEKIAERLRQELAAAAIPHEHSSIGHWLTVSVGVAAIVPDAMQSSRELVQLADAALYNAKGSGRNRVTLASQTAA